ncbi:induction peptide AbpIP family protein [Flavobacterium sp. ZB4P13]
MKILFEVFTEKRLQCIAGIAPKKQTRQISKICRV